MRSYKIIVDGAEVGKLRPRGVMSVDVDAGPHTCQARIDWSGSEPISVSVRAGAEVRIGVSPAPGRTLGRAVSSAGWLVLTPDDDSTS